MKRLSKSLITALLVTMLAFAFIGCQTTQKVTEIAPPKVVVTEQPAEKVEQEVAKEEVAVVVEEVKAPAVVAEVKVPEMPKRNPPTPDMVVKSNDRFEEFDLYIAHTNDVMGALEEGPGIGYAKLATGVKFGRSLTDKTLLLDAGNVASGTAMVEKYYGEPAGTLLALLGYDAVAPGPADFAYGAAYLKSVAQFAAENTDIKVLSANVLNAKGEWVFQPYQLYYYNDFVVGVVGVTAPPADTEGLSFLDPAIVANAQYAVNELRKVADFVVVLGSIGNVNGITSEVIAENVKGIDLIVDGKGAMAPAGGKKVGSTVIVSAGEMMSSVGLVEVHVKNDKATTVTPIRITAKDVQNPKASPLAKAVGITTIPADKEVAGYISSVKNSYAKSIELVKVELPAKTEPAPVVAVVEEVKAPEMPKRNPPTADMVVKSNDRFEEFDLYIAHTNDVMGALEEGPGIGYAKLATGVKFGRSLTDKTLLLDAGNVASGTAMVEKYYGEPAGTLLALLGYDAVAPGPADFAYGAAYLKSVAQFAAENTDIKVLSANVLNAKGEWVFQPYQLYYYNDFVVGVVGVTAPPADTEGLSFLDPAIVANAQYAVNELRKVADFVVVLGSIGNVNGITSEVIAENVKGIDLIVDGKGAMAPAGGKKVGSTVIVSAGEMMSSVGLVEVHVKNDKATTVTPIRITAKDVQNPKASPLAKAVGITTIPADKEVAGYISSVKNSYAKSIELVKVELPAKTEPAPVVAVVEEVKAPEMPKRNPPTADMVVKSNDRFEEFDLYIAHTNDVMGALEEGPGIGYAKLATGVKFGRSLTDKTLLLDAGNVASGTAMVEKYYGEPAGTLLALLGYDAVAPGPADFAYGAAYLKSVAQFAAENTDIKVLSANVLNAKGEWVFQPYQLYYYNDFVVGVVGVTAPPADTEGLSFLDPAIVANAQYAVNELRKVADFVVVLGSIGNVNGITSEVIAENVKGIDLIVDGKGAMAPAGGKKVGSTVIVSAGEMMSSVGLVEVHVKNDKATTVTPIRITAKDVQNPKASPLAKAVGITTIPADKEVAGYISSVKNSYARSIELVKVELPAKAEPAPVVAVVEEVKAPVVVEAKMPDVPKDVIVKSNDGEKNFNLYVVHTNDVHGRIEANPGVGYANLATLLKMGRSVTDKNLVLDAGDVTHGTLLTNLFEGETAGVLLDLLKYDAVAPGNHDFNYGKDRLIEAAKFANEYTDIKVLSANVLDANKNMVFQPYQLYYFDGFTVGVVGLTTPDTETKTHPKNVEGLSFMSDEVVYGAQALIDEVKSKADYVIVLGHIGLDADGSYNVTSKMIAENIKGIDLFIDGHSHTVLENGLRVGDTLIVQAGEYMEYVGLVEIQVRNGKAVNENSYLISADQVADPSTSDLAKAVGITKIAPDAEVTAYVASQKAKVESITKEVVAYTPVLLEGERADVRTRPTNLGNMIADAMVEATGADVALTNGGGIRASIKAGNVSRGDIITVLPFNNVVVVVEVTGQDIYDALEWGYSKLPESNGGFPQTSNMRIVYSRFSDPGNRIKRVLINGKSVDKNATYTLATNDFMAAGGDGYTMLDRKVTMYGRGLDEVLTDYMVKHNKK